MVWYNMVLSHGWLAFRFLCHPPTFLAHPRIVKIMACYDIVYKFLRRMLSVFSVFPAC